MGERGENMRSSADLKKKRQGRAADAEKDFFFPDAEVQPHLNPGGFPKKIRILRAYYYANILRVNRFVDFLYEKPGKISRRCYWLRNRKNDFFDWLRAEEIRERMTPVFAER